MRDPVYGRLADYEDINGAERLAEDPTFRMLASRERRKASVALTPALLWFEAEVLTIRRAEETVGPLYRIDGVEIQAGPKLLKRRSSSQRHLSCCGSLLL